jgi:alpha-L-fucosidase
MKRILNDKELNEKTSELENMSTMWGGSASDNEAEHPRASWFRSSKFAMFIHWGLYSEAGNIWNGKNVHGISEWLMRREKITVREYEKLATRFNPVDFNADEVAKLAKDAGMRYIVLTAKHHEGFALFKSEASPFNIVDATPYGRDVIKELAEACRAYDLGIGFYYSQYLDWHEQDAAGNDWEFGEPRDFERYFRNKALPQIAELLTNYGPVSLIWFDTPGAMARESSQEICDLVHRLQPNCLINSRIGNGLGDYSSLGDQEVPLTVPEGLWETVDTHNDTWGYSVHDHHWKSPRELISRLVRVASLGGTYMLNVGPTGNGAILSESGDILRTVGNWLELHGKGIYDCLPSPLPAQPWGVMTMEPQRLFLHVLQWPSNGTLLIPGFEGVVRKATVMATGQEIPTGQEKGVLNLEIPAIQPVSPITTLILDYEGEFGACAKQRILHPGLTNFFEAPFSAIDRCSKGKRRWMEKFGDWHHSDVIENISTGSTIGWSFNTVGESLWKIDLEYECLPGADGSELELSIGNTLWCFPVQATTGNSLDRTRIRRETLGTMQIPGPGNFTLCIRGIDIRGSGELIIQRIILESVDTYRRKQKG